MNLDTYTKQIGFHEMTAADFDSLRTATKKVFELMKDGEWHAAQDIINASGTREGLRRMRELRPHFQIESHRQSLDNRDWIYRIV